MIDRGAVASVDAASIRCFPTRVPGARETSDMRAGTRIRSGHRVPEEVLRGEGIPTPQAPDPEPLRAVGPDMSTARQMQAEADHGRLWLALRLRMVRSGRIMRGARCPALVHGHHAMAPSPVARRDALDVSVQALVPNALTRLQRGRRITMGRADRIFDEPRHAWTRQLVLAKP